MNWNGSVDLSLNTIDLDLPTGKTTPSKLTQPDEFPEKLNYILVPRLKMSAAFKLIRQAIRYQLGATVTNRGRVPAKFSEPTSAKAS